MSLTRRLQSVMKEEISIIFTNSDVQCEYLVIHEHIRLQVVSLSDNIVGANASGNEPSGSDPSGSDPNEGLIEVYQDILK